METSPEPGGLCEYFALLSFHTEIFFVTSSLFLKIFSSLLRSEEKNNPKVYEMRGKLYEVNHIENETFTSTVILGCLELIPSSLLREMAKKQSFW